MNGIHRQGIRSKAIFPRLREKPAEGAAFGAALPFPLSQLPWSLIRQAGCKATERAVIRALRGADPARTVVYAFPGMSLDAAREVRSRGIPLIREMTNLHRGTARRIIAEEHRAEGLPPFEDISPTSVEEEVEWLSLATHVVAPNPHVRNSLVEYGVPASHIYDSSYGWSLERFPNIVVGEKRSPGGRVAMFAGRVSYQKGAHHLLRAWHAARCPGKLVLAGTVEEALAGRLSGLLDHPSIEQLGHVADMGAVYSKADYFVFPSLVEGGPQVVYEAAAHGLPVIVSPMGAGRLSESASFGEIVDPYGPALAGAIADYAMRGDLADLGADAAKWAQAFEWGAVGADRARVIELATEECRWSI